MNRKSKGMVASDDTCNIPSKKTKIDPERHSYPPLSLEVEDEMCIQRNMTLLKQELLKSKLHFDSVASLMHRTFPLRRQSILENVDSVAEIIQKYPFLSKSVYVRTFQQLSHFNLNILSLFISCPMSFV